MFITSQNLKQHLHQQTAANAATLMQQNSPLALSVFCVGDNPASKVYVAIKQKSAERAGIACRVFFLPENISQQHLNNHILAEANNPDTTGILLQLPLPSHLNTAESLACIPPLKDVDGLTVTNTGLAETGQAQALLPATPLGIMRILAWQQVALSGLEVCVVGRSHLVGRPVASLLSQQGATVTLCHSATRNLKNHTSRADLLVCATGVPHLIQPDMIKPDAMLVDVGITPLTRADGNRSILGDIHPDCATKAVWQTQVPGGVGPMTVASLFTNVIDAAFMQANLTRPVWQLTK